MTMEEDYGFLLLAAHFFRAAEECSRLSMEAETRLSLDFSVKWEGIDMLQLLSASLLCK